MLNISFVSIMKLTTKEVAIVAKIVDKLTEILRENGLPGVFALVSQGDEYWFEFHSPENNVSVSSRDVDEDK